VKVEVDFCFKNKVMNNRQFLRQVLILESCVLIPVSVFTPFAIASILIFASQQLRIAVAQASSVAPVVTHVVNQYDMLSVEHFRRITSNMFSTFSHLS
jgi:hypothetical protein